MNTILVVGGYLQFGYDLGSGPAIIHNGKIRVDDGERHAVVLKRRGKEGSVEVDYDYTEYGAAEGITNTLNCDGDIYLGNKGKTPHKNIRSNSPSHLCRRHSKRKPDDWWEIHAGFQRCHPRL